MMNDSSGITAVVLAGGRARRMDGRDKGLVLFQGRPLVAHVAEILAPQVDELFINANRNLEEYAELGHPVIRDDLDGFQGPLAGVLSAMRRARNPLLLVAPCDAPLLPADFAQRMKKVLETADADLAVAFDGQRLQRTHALLPCRLADDLAAYLKAGGREVGRWYAGHKMKKVDWSELPGAFTNVNTPDELARLEQGSVPKSRA